MPPPPNDRNRGQGRPPAKPSGLPRWTIWVLLGVVAALLFGSQLLSSTTSKKIDYTPDFLNLVKSGDVPDAETLRVRIGELEKAMKAAAKELDFERAAELRDELRSLRELQIFR